MQVWSILLIFSFSCALYTKLSHINRQFRRRYKCQLLHSTFQYNCTLTVTPWNTYYVIINYTHSSCNHIFIFIYGSLKKGILKGIRDKYGDLQKLTLHVNKIAQQIELRNNNLETGKKKTCKKVRNKRRNVVYKNPKLRVDMQNWLAVML